VLAICSCRDRRLAEPLRCDADVEAPDDATLAALTVSVAKLGNITTQTSRAFIMAEVSSIP